MFFNYCISYFLELYLLGSVLFFMLLLTWLKLFKKSIELNNIFCNLFIMIMFSSLFFFNYFIFFEIIFNNYMFDIINFIKNILILFYIIFAIISLNYFKNYKEGYVLPDFYLLLFFVFLTNCILVNTSNMINFYIALEMQNLIFFVLAGLVRNKWFVIEATFRYFLISGFTTMLFLLSLCCLWSITGLLEFEHYFIMFNNLNQISYFYIFFLISIIFLFISFSTKLGLFPFHWWMVDVYEGIPMLITFFFMVIPKILLIFFVLKFYYFYFFFSIFSFYYLFFFLSLGSIFWGLFRGLFQYSLIRFFVYSTMFNLGFMFIGIFSYTLLGNIITLFYLMGYLSTVIGIFFILLSLKIKNMYGGLTHLSTLFDLSFLMNKNKKNNLYLILMLIVFLFSLAGVPPFFGFISKFFILEIFIFTQSYFYFFLFLFFSVFACFYYLRIIRFLFFGSQTSVNVLVLLTEGQAYVLSLLFIFQICFFLFFNDGFLYLVNIYLNFI